MNMNMWDHFVNKIIFKWTEPSLSWLEVLNGMTWTRAFTVMTSPSSTLPFSPVTAAWGSRQTRCA